MTKAYMKYVKSLRFAICMLISVACCSALATNAFAAGKAAAEALFERGRALFVDQKYDEACAAFEASQELEAGIGTLLYLGACYEKQNRTASAWATFREAEALAHSRGDDREELAIERASALELKLSKIVIRVPQAHRLTDLVVQLDGQRVPAGSWGTPIPVDPGKRVVEVSAPGREPFRTTVTIAEQGSAYDVDVPLLDLVQHSTVETEKPTPASLVTVPGKGAREKSHTQRTLAWSLGGAGLAAVAVASVLGLQAKNKNDDSERECPQDPELCTPRGVEMREDARRFAQGSNVAFVVGGGLLAASAVLFITLPSERSRVVVRSSAHHHGAAMTLGGSF